MSGRGSVVRAELDDTQPFALVDRARRALGL